jgi:hypothetical protein
VRCLSGHVSNLLLAAVVWFNTVYECAVLMFRHLDCSWGCAVLCIQLLQPGGPGGNHVGTCVQCLLLAVLPYVLHFLCCLGTWQGMRHIACNHMVAVCMLELRQRYGVSGEHARRFQMHTVQATAKYNRHDMRLKCGVKNSHHCVPNRQQDLVPVEMLVDKMLDKLSAATAMLFHCVICIGEVGTGWLCLNVARCCGAACTRGIPCTWVCVYSLGTVQHSSILIEVTRTDIINGIALSPDSLHIAAYMTQVVES